MVTSPPERARGDAAARRPAGAPGGLAGWVPAAAALALTAGLAGCWSGGPRKPLFGGDEAPGPQPAGARGPGGDGAAGPSAAPRRDTPVDRLLARLRAARTEDERRAVARELVARLEAKPGAVPGGPEAGGAEDARALLEGARDEQALLVDLLDDALRALDAAWTSGAADAAGGPPAGGHGPRARRVDAPWVDEKAALAHDRYLAGDLWGALRLIDALLALEPDAQARERLLRLRRRARDRTFSESALVAELVADADPISPGTPLRARVRFRNVGREPVTLKLGPDRAIGVLSLVYEEAGPSGERTRARSEHLVLAPDDLVLRPGARHEEPIDLASPHAGLRAPWVGRLHLGGRLRVHTLLVGDTTWPYFVPLLPVTVLALPGPDLELAADPKASFARVVATAREALGPELDEAARQAFVAALAWGHRDRDAALEAVAEALAPETDRGPLVLALCSALGRLTGEPLSFSRAEWLAWWQGRRSRPAPSEEPAGQ